MNHPPNPGLKKADHPYDRSHYTYRTFIFLCKDFSIRILQRTRFGAKKEGSPFTAKSLYNHNHQLNWWFAMALKGPYASSVSRRTEKVCQPHDFLRLRLKALFYYLLFLATRERVDIFFHTYLVICDVLLQLISDVLFYRFFVSSNCIYIISSTPEMSISIFIF